MFVAFGNFSWVGGLGGGDVAKPEWGNKCMCQTCGTRFYDLKKTVVLCPNCNEPHVAKPAKSAELKQARAARPQAKPAARPKVEAPPEPPPPSMDDDDIKSEKKTDADDMDLAKDIQSDEADDGDEEEPIEDARELSEDQDEVAEVLEVKVEKTVAER